MTEVDRAINKLIAQMNLPKRDIEMTTESATLFLGEKARENFRKRISCIMSVTDSCSVDLERYIGLYLFALTKIYMCLDVYENTDKVIRRDVVTDFQTVYLSLLISSLKTQSPIAKEKLEALSELLRLMSEKDADNEIENIDLKAPTKEQIEKAEERLEQSKEAFKE